MAEIIFQAGTPDTERLQGGQLGEVENADGISYTKQLLFVPS